MTSIDVVHNHTIDDYYDGDLKVKTRTRQEKNKAIIIIIKR